MGSRGKGVFVVILSGNGQSSSTRAPFPNPGPSSSSSGFSLPIGLYIGNCCHCRLGHFYVSSFVKLLKAGGQCGWVWFVCWLVSLLIELNTLFERVCTIIITILFNFFVLAMTTINSYVHLEDCFNEWTRNAPALVVTYGTIQLACLGDSMSS